MDRTYENLSTYGEEVKGKFSYKPQENGIIISVTSPFVEEIHIKCDDDISKEYSETYSLLPPQAEHPEGNSWCIYYNTEKQCYYRSGWQLVNLTTEKSKWEYVWFQTHERYIVKHAREYEELQAHFRSYHNMHKGQLCVFWCYAVDPNGNLKKPSTVESMFDRHKWFYNPWSFQVSLLDENTVDDFVEGTPISEKMTNQMVSYYGSRRKDEKQARSREFRQHLFGKIPKFIQFVENHPTWSVGIIGAIVGSLLTFFLKHIEFLVKEFLDRFSG